MNLKRETRKRKNLLQLQSLLFRVGSLLVKGQKITIRYIIKKSL